MAAFNSEDVIFIEIAPVDDLPSGERMFLEIGDEPIVIFNIAGNFYAIGDVCTHDGGPLGDGEMDGHQVICPRHGARFDVRDGKALTMPAVVDAPSFPVEVQDGMIFLGVPK
jgi:3-phenylpropionate/trans-cinnamate dioxygenase ferredoxin component